MVATSRKPITPLQTPTPTSARTPLSRRPDATILYTLPGGYSMYLTPSEYEETEKDLVPPTEAAAHPPASALLFRYWTDASQSKLIQGQFKAGRFRTINIAPPPLPKLGSPHFPLSDFFMHLNRNEVASPFISTSNFLLWIVRLAAKKAASGVTGGFISIIDATQLEERNVFHVPPFHASLCKKRPFERGAHYYHGSHEFMVYHEIPSNAVIRTIAVQDLSGLASADSMMRDVLRLDILSKPGDYRSKLRKMLKDGDVELTPSVVTAIARFCKTLGLGRNSSIEHISHVVADMVLGWAFRVEHLSAHEWQNAASIFAHVLCRRSVPTAGIQDLQRIKMGFLDGVKWGMGTYNVRHSPISITDMKRKAKSVGLESPAKIISDEMDATKLHIWAYEKRQQRLLGGVGRNAPLMLDEPVTPSLSRRGAGRVWQTVAGGNRSSAVMMYAEDEFGDEEDEDEEEYGHDEIIYD
ncbi:hypothetical protein LTR36_001353 [Oleoguttula mirabilis]|uniref:DUF7587 domain-containing protein n=1 Tax=Oleoguttula mirabilis TaxID=1507867 RepID=A0AAV9JQ66_9PEZI|nr:hypothetical protein LTR36_001353 [Oleoguttula mirabilis]